jgi:predicted SPOUT superfamily RNA methylase MTH1
VRVLEVVPPEEPREKAGLYWGYTVRHTSCLSAVFTDCPFMGGYDYIIGTSEHGQKIRAAEFTIPKFKHLLIVFGGVAGLEESKELDKTIKVFPFQLSIIKCCDPDEIVSNQIAFSSFER